MIDWMLREKSRSQKWRLEDSRAVHWRWCAGPLAWDHWFQGLKISEQDTFGVDDKGNIVRRIIWQFPELKSMIRRDIWTSREDWSTKSKTRLFQFVRDCKKRVLLFDISLLSTKINKNKTETTLFCVTIVKNWFSPPTTCKCYVQKTDKFSVTLLEEHLALAEISSEPI